MERYNIGTQILHRKLIRYYKGKYICIIQIYLYIMYNKISYDENVFFCKNNFYKAIILSCIYLFITNYYILKIYLLPGASLATE